MPGLTNREIRTHELIQELCQKQTSHEARRDMFAAHAMALIGRSSSSFPAFRRNQGARNAVWPARQSWTSVKPHPGPER